MPEAEDLPTGLRLNERILIARTRARLEQQDLAQRMGVSRPTVSNWERGATAPTSAATWRGLADALGVPEAWLRGPTPSFTSNP